jgi:anti-anti-sigma factor
MNIDIIEDDSTLGVKISGDIDMLTIKDFKHKMLDIAQTVDKNFIFDLEDVKYIDSSGIGVLISISKILKKKGKTLKISKVSGKVKTILEISSILDMFQL